MWPPELVRVTAQPLFVKSVEVAGGTEQAGGRAPEMPVEAADENQATYSSS